MEKIYFVSPTTTAPFSNQTSCAAVLHIAGLSIRAPLAVFACLIASVIGLTGFSRIKALHTHTGNSTYRWSCLLYAFMMPSSMLISCFLKQQYGLPLIIIGLFDGGMTNSIAFSFAVNGLVDLGLLKDGTKITYATLIGGSLACFGGYISILTKHGSQGFVMKFYVYTIAACCGFYCLSQVVWLVRNRFRAFHFLLLGGLAGGVGLSTVAVPKLSSFLCSYLGPVLSGYFEGTVWWDSLSDVAMLSLLAYFINRQPAASSSKAFTITVADEQELLLHA